MEKIKLTDVQAVALIDACRPGNRRNVLGGLVSRVTARALYAKGLTDQPGYFAQLNAAGLAVAEQLREHPARRTFHVEVGPKLRYRIQPAERPDAMSTDGHVGYQLPWPVVAHADGSVLGAHDHWCGKVVRVIGFQADLRKQRIDLHWDDFLRGPQKAKGMYLVTSDKDGAWGVHDTAVSTVEEQEVPA